MGKASRDKGKRGEREARDQVRAHWESPECVRSAQVSGQFSGDLLGVPDGIHVEVKFYKRIVALDFLEQAKQDAASDEVPVVLMRENGGGWVVMMPMEASVDFASRLLQHIRERED